MRLPRLALIAPLALAACGFAPPPADYAELFEDGVQVETAEGGARLARELRHWLAQAGVSEGPGWKLRILSYEEDHDALAFNRRGIISEYRLYARAEIEIRRGQRKTAHRLSSVRHLRQNFFLLNDTLGEEAFLREEMDRQLARRCAEKLAQQARAERAQAP